MSLDVLTVLIGVSLLAAVAVLAWGALICLGIYAYRNFIKSP